MIGDTTTLDDGYGSGLSLTAEDSANLRKAGKWARFLGIVYMVILGLIILGVVAGGSTFLVAAGLSDVPTGALVFGLAFYGGILAFSFYLVFLQYQFGSKAMQAVDQGDRGAITTSLAALGRFYKITGIVLLIYVVFFGLGLVFALVGGGLAAVG